MPGDFNVSDDDLRRHEANMEIAREMLSDKEESSKALEDSTEANLMLAQQLEELRLATDNERDALAEHARVMQDLFGEKTKGTEEPSSFVVGGMPRTALEAGERAEAREYDDKSLELLEAIRDNTARLAGFGMADPATKQKRKVTVPSTKRGMFDGLLGSLAKLSLFKIGVGIAAVRDAWLTLSEESPRLAEALVSVKDTLVDGAQLAVKGWGLIGEELLSAGEWVVTKGIPKVKETIGDIADAFIWAGKKIRDGASFIFNSILDAWEAVAGWFGKERPVRGYPGKAAYLIEAEELSKLGPSHRKTQSEIQGGFDPLGSGTATDTLRAIHKDQLQNRPQRDKEQRAESHEQNVQQTLMFDNSEELKSSTAATEMLTEGIKRLLDTLERQREPVIAQGDTGIGLNAIPSVSPDRDLQGIGY